MAKKRRKKQTATHVLLSSTASKLTDKLNPQNWSPRTQAGVKRAVKLAGFYVLGYVLALAAFATVAYLTNIEADPMVIQILGFTVSTITGGIHKSINWTAAGVDVNAIPVPSPDASLPQIAIPQQGGTNNES